MDTAFRQFVIMSLKFIVMILKYKMTITEEAIIRKSDLKRLKKWHKEVTEFEED